MLPPGRIQIDPSLDQPQILETSFGVQHQLPRGFVLNATYINRRATRQSRGRNLNAPIDGARRDPFTGNITNVESTARGALDAVALNFQFMNPQRRLSLAANYFYSRSRNDADNALSLPSNNYDPRADWGPALDDVRHRAMGFVTASLGKGFRLGTSFRFQSGVPYNLTTGFDDNGDTVFNDRPSGVGRNSARGSLQLDVASRLSWGFAFGHRAPAPGGPQVRVIRAGPDTDVLGQVGGGMPNPNKRYSVELYAQAFNFVNRMNPIAYSGVQTSPFFGNAIAAAPARRIELGARFGF